MIFVDELQQWPGAKRPFHEGFCHLTCNGTDEELHTFALALGLRRVWFQVHRVANHYDLTPGKRILALRLGACFMAAREQIVRRRENRWEGSVDFKP